MGKLEVDLDAARQYLFKLRRAVYGNEPSVMDNSTAHVITKNTVPSRGGRGGGVPPRRGAAAPRGVAPRGGARPSSPARGGAPRGAPRGVPPRARGAPVPPSRR